MKLQNSVLQDLHMSSFNSSSQEYIVAGENYMRVKFYVSGAHRKGTVHVDVKQVIWRLLLW